MINKSLKVKQTKKINPVLKKSLPEGIRIVRASTPKEYLEITKLAHKSYVEHEWDKEGEIIYRATDFDPRNPFFYATMGKNKAPIASLGIIQYSNEFEIPTRKIFPQVDEVPEIKKACEFTKLATDPKYNRINGNVTSTLMRICLAEAMKTSSHILAVVSSDSTSQRLYKESMWFQKIGGPSPREENEEDIVTLLDLDLRGLEERSKKEMSHVYEFWFRDNPYFTGKKAIQIPEPHRASKEGLESLFYEEDGSSRFSHKEMGILENLWTEN